MTEKSQIRLAKLFKATGKLEEAIVQLKKHENTSLYEPLRNSLIILQLSKKYY